MMIEYLCRRKKPLLCMKKILLFLSLISLPCAVVAAETTGDPETYKPTVFGAVKAKFETSLYGGDHRFNVRNSRIGVKGYVSPYMKYGAQIDFSNEGKLTVLDAYATIERPWDMSGRNQFGLSLGQQQYHFSSDLDRGPSNNLFSNRSFLAKFLTTYYGVDQNGREFISSIGARDIGVKFKYAFYRLPIRISAGIFNGSGVNNPEWSNNMNFVAKVDFGSIEGLGLAVSHYNGKTPLEGAQVIGIDHRPATEEQKIRMWGGELRFNGPIRRQSSTHDNAYVIEAEYAQRRLNNGGVRILSAAHVQGYYRFDFSKKFIGMFDYLTPLARWDLGDDIEFMNRVTGSVDRFSAQRATLGVNLGFVSRMVHSEVRLSGEKFFFDRKPSDYGINPLLQDKITIEIVATF